MTTYLKRVKNIWNVICDKNDEFRLHLNFSTIQILQKRCPIFSKNYEYIVQRKETFFPRFENVNQRARLMLRIRSICYVIPFLHIFLENTKYLEFDAKIMKILLSLDCKTLIHEKFFDLHNNQKHWKKKIAENNFDRFECSQRQDETSGDMTHWKTYHQFWMFALRYFSEMTKYSSWKNASKSKPLHQNIEKLWWYDITKLANACEYKNIQISYNITHHAEIEMTKIFFSVIRPALFAFSKKESSTFAEKIIRFVNLHRNSSVKAFIIFRNYCENDIVYRCDISFENFFKINQKTLFWNNIYVKNRIEKYLTSFAVKRNIFHVFFETLVDSEMNFEYDHFWSILSTVQTKKISTNQIKFSQSVALNMLFISQFMPIIRRKESSTKISRSQIEIFSTSETKSSIISSFILATFHVSETEMNVTTQFHDSELQITLLSSSQKNALAITLMILSSNKTLLLIEAISKFQNWTNNSSINLMMILVQHDKINEQIWHIWYVLRSDREKIMIILLSKTIYYYQNRDSIKRRKIINTQQICDKSVKYLIISQHNDKHVLNLFYDDDH